MKINEQLEKEIATRLGLTKPVAPKDVAAYIADTELFSQAVSSYHAPQISWRATTGEARATILQTRQLLAAVEELADKVDDYSDTIQLATTAYHDALRAYWHKIEREEDKPRQAFKQAQEEFIALMEKEKRSLKRKQNKADWQGEEYKEISARLELVEYLASEAGYFTYHPETAPEFNEETLWEQISKAEWRATAFLKFVSEHITA